MSSVLDFLSVPVESRTRDQLLEMLQCAIKLEHATLPPYLTAMWSIKDTGNPAYGILRSVIFEEMGHMGTVCNLLSALDGHPAITATDFVPRYPTRLPCDIAPKVTPPNVIDWKVGLARLTPAVVSDVFMIIEYPEEGPVQVMELAADLALARPRYHTIGEFYDAICGTLDYLVNAKKAKITPGLRQITEEFFPIDREYNAVKPINTLDDAVHAIEHIKEQGEGTPSTPDAPMFGNELAHYYKFKQIQVGRLFAQQANKSWTLSGNFFDFPAVYPMADIPEEGYKNVPAEVASLIKAFTDDYKKMLASLQSAWEKGGKEGQTYLDEAESAMRRLGKPAVDLMQIPIDAAHPEKGNYGPTFQVS